MPPVKANLLSVLCTVLPSLLYVTRWPLFDPSLGLVMSFNACSSKNPKGFLEKQSGGVRQLAFEYQLPSLLAMGP